MPTTPIRRHPALVPYSQEHHSGLMIVLLVKKGLQAGAATERIAAYIQACYTQELQPHFAAEETHLLPLLPPAHAMRLRILQEHRQLELLVQEIAKPEASQHAIQSFMTLLETHIRYEEREVFNYLQDTVPHLLTNLLQAAHPAACSISSTWPDAFWKG